MAKATGPDARLWAWGCYAGVRKAAKATGLSRQELTAATNAGEIAWFPHGERRVRMISRRSVALYLARLHAATK